MNVSDAKESITKVASLKERMAALQGRGGFGAGPAPPPVKPAVEKPKWKPPPQVVPTPPEEGGKVEEGEGPGGEGDGDLDAPRAVQAPVSIIGVQSGEEVVAGQGAEEENVEGDGAAEADPEEEERQRRAAIAARMARLGGARVGMAPMFGRPSVTKKPEAVVKPAAEDVNAPETTTEGKYIFIWAVCRITNMFSAAPRPPVSRSSSLSVSSSGMFVSLLPIGLANSSQRNLLKEKIPYLLLSRWRLNTATILLPCPCHPLLGELDHRERRFQRPPRSLLLK